MSRINYRPRMGMVFSMTNAAENNEIVAFSRRNSGMLAHVRSYATGGSGTGAPVIDPLESQSSVIISRDGCFLFAVNAGSNSISSFRISDCGALVLADVQPSGGIMPNSLSIFDDILYVSNMGNASKDIVSNITGFYVEDDGRLTQIDGATYPLSADKAKPACVAFSQDGTLLVVSERNTNLLSVFSVNNDGTLNGPVINDSSGEGPFGAVFLLTGLLLVAEARTNALSSYSVKQDETLNRISSSVLNGQLATCWVVPSLYERYAYTSNTGSGTITSYRITDKGSLSLAQIVYSAKEGIAAPIDIGVSMDGFNLYVLNGDQGSISVFYISENSRLIRLQVFRDKSMPMIGAQGLAVR